MPSNELIQRRIKVIELADKGLTNKEIANELGISTSTVSSDKKAYHNNPNAYKKTVKKTTKTTTSKQYKPTNKQTTTNENKTTTASTANNTVKTTDKTVKTAHDDTENNTADNDKTLPAVNTDTTKTDGIVNDTNDGTVKIKETGTTTGNENTASNVSNADNNSNSSNADNADIDSNSSISGDDIVNDVNDMMDKAIHDFQGKLHNIAVEARKEMGLPTDTAPEYGNESPSDNSQSDADNANITPVNTTNTTTVNTDNAGNVGNTSNVDNASTSRLVKSHVVSPNNIITNSGIITGINNSSQHSYDHSIIANMIGSNDTNAYNVFKNLNDKEKWDAKEQEKSNAYVRGFLTGGFIIAIIGIILNILF